MPGRAQLIRLDRRSHGFQLVDQHFEPEFVDLVDNDEEQLVVRLSQAGLKGQQLGDMEIAAVAQPAAGGILVAHSAEAVGGALTLVQVFRRSQAGLSLARKSATTSASKGGDA